MAAPMDRIILQSDFDEVLREHNGKVWVSFKCSGRETVHGQLESHGISGDGVPYVMPSEGFNVLKVSQRSIEVSYTQDETCCSRQFVAPTKTFNNIHSERKSIHCLDVTAGGLGVSSDSEGKLKVWETQTGDVRRDLEGHYGDVYTCRFFPSGVVILTGGADMQLKIWSAETGKCAATLKGHLAGILDTAIIDRGRNILSCGRDGTVRLWDCGSQTCLGTIECGAGNVNCCTLQNTESNIDLGTPTDTPSEKEVGTEGKLLLVGCEKGVLQGYGLQSRTKVFDLDCHGDVNSCCFLSDTCIACGTQEGYITVSDIRNIRVPLKEWKESRNVILSLLPYKGGFFSSTGDGSCFYVNQNYETLVELSGSDCDPLYKTVSDGHYVYSACRDSLIRKYSIAHMIV
ncbi:proteasomal ATPase-associated factor 1-like [Ruditapes philippinarum]|uniref:proteasomal ATPase-associated factor 1-like n=1 Tax=Ruditapes philippinarum TaxID=129788 RepID=UPI00295C27C8|nr:proteasomal ATPase-associated factor 1-like [Ruditapes philippinarum]